MDFSNTPNPYDFANPVTRQEMFFGRTDEMNEIRYYLDHAKTADRPINIALLGDRAAGKTSILNMTEIEARSRGCCTARIDLDEDDANSQISFFYKVFDGILGEACRMGAFGGLGAKTYETYLSVTSCFCVPDDKLFCPFLFPIQFAFAMKANNDRALVSDHSIKHDLALISDELKRPVAVLFDESNVLARSRVLLEKIRNIFMNIPGYMLVLTGTPDLFPVMDDVFSPIVRQFKKINVKEFSNKVDTENLVRKPLQRRGIALEVSDSEVSDIHRLSSGRPYEIQLICHLLFRRIQTSRAARMRLDLAVLEELRRELERSQDISGRKVLGSVMALGRKQLQALGILTQCNGRAPFEHLWNLHYAFEGTGLFTKNQLAAELDILKARGILSETDGAIRFEGDSFDSLYVKYFAAEQKISVEVRSVPFELALVFGIMRLVPPRGQIEVYIGPDAWESHQAAAEQLTSEDSNVDALAEGQLIADDLYFQMVDFRRKKEIPVVVASVSLSGASTAVMITPLSEAKDDTLEKLKKNLTAVKTRIENVGGALNIERHSLPVARLDLLSQKVTRTANEARRKRLAKGHVSRVADAWLGGNKEEAELHAELALTYDPEITGKPANNLGYYFLAVGKSERASELFRRALESPEGSEQTKTLAAYNLAVSLLMAGQRAPALEMLRSNVQAAKALAEDERRAACLLVPAFGEGGITFPEVSGPDIVESWTTLLARLQDKAAQA